MKRVLGRWLMLVTVRGHSMEPALRDGAVVLARRIGGRAGGGERLPGRLRGRRGRLPGRRGGRAGRRLRVGQVVVLPVQLPGGARVVGPVADGDGLWVKRIAALPGDPVPAGVPGCPGRVPPGRMAVLGDNAASSTDSRSVGLVPVDVVVAVVLGTNARPPAAGRDGGPGANDAAGRQRGRQDSCQ
ncbi:S26 family signal peptidase [Streptomyces sp. NPDC007808]|uniref:S26 family signal peptidase n=1 Tax=Streptomyces sp. NPDC007808 TaxID=3364779 RepID=UPI00369261A6